MSRSSYKLLGALFLIPSLAMGLLPLIVEHSNLLNGLGGFAWVINGKTIVELHRDVNGVQFASVWGGVWVVAIIAEVLLLVATVLKPTKHDRHVISWRNL